ncbi:MAG: response regulator transcription factor [bacterium]|nr:response regulator transcription factor [bacterium]
MKILVVEDEPEISKFIERGLHRQRFAVDIVDDGRLGLFNASVNQYDIILCDYMLPHRDGISLTQELRDRSVKTPLLMLTVVDDLQTKVRALDAGADDFMCKPFAFDELLARIRAISRRQTAWQGDVVHLDDLAIDTKAYQVTRAGKPITLTRKEFMLLEYLVRNQGRVVTRSELLEHVWDSATDQFTNSIEVHIRYLRKKIDLPFGSARKLIHTIHGVGYKACRI